MRRTYDLCESVANRINHLTGTHEPKLNIRRQNDCYNIEYVRDGRIVDVRSGLTCGECYENLYGLFSWICAHVN